jgi:hypothetical protein
VPGIKKKKNQLTVDRKGRTEERAARNNPTSRT